MSSQTPGTPATLPSIGIDPDDDVVPESIPHGCRFPCSSINAAEVGVSMKAHMELVSQVTDLRETLAPMQSTLAQSGTERVHLREALALLQSAFA